MFDSLIVSHVFQTMTSLVQVKEFQKLQIHQGEKSNYKESLENVNNAGENGKERKRGKSGKSFTALLKCFNLLGGPDRQP